MLRVVVDILVLVGLVATNGFLAASEIALVSSRPARLRPRAEAGDRGAVAALELLEKPNQFLSAVQVGITVVGIVAGAWGGATLGNVLGRWLAQWMSPPVAMLVAVGTVVAVVTYLTVVLGELVPKRLALASPERIACRVAPSMRLLARVTRPAVVVLSISTDRVLRLLPVRRLPEPAVTEEEVRTILAEATAAGVLEDREHDIVKRLFLLSDLTAGSLMTPREKIVWIDLQEPAGAELLRVGTLTHARFLICDGALDRVRGYVSVPDLLGQLLATGVPDLSAILRKPHFVGPWDTAFHLLEVFQRSSDHIALVMGTKGRVEGVVTLNDILQGIVGDLPEPEIAPAPGAVQREDGSWLVDGLIPFEDFLAIVGRDPEGAEAFPTLHAFVVDHLGEEPEASQVFRWRGVRLEVVDMDGRRVDKVLVQEE